MVGLAGEIKLHNFFINKGKAEQHTQDVNRALFQLFPFLSEITQCEDIDLDKRGVDKILKLLFFDSGKMITINVIIDEKIRFEDYGDILLEEWSNKEKRIAGWACRKKITDFILFYWPPTGRLIILPFLLLQAIYVKNYKKWRKLYGTKEAENKNYVTTNIPVPTEIIMSEMINIMQGYHRIFNQNYGGNYAYQKSF